MTGALATAQSDYRWRPVSSSRDAWLGPSQQGTLPELAEQYPQASLILLCSGFDTVVREYGFSRKERKYLLPLLSNALEPDLASDLSSVHIVLGVPDITTERACLVYADKRWLSAEISVLEAAGFEVIHCLPEPLLLASDDHSWSCLCDGDQLHWRWGKAQAGTVDVAMLGDTLEALSAQVRANALPEPEALYLVATDAESLERIAGEVVASPLLHERDNLVKTRRCQEIWDALEPDVRGLPDLRSGAFSAPLRWRKFWQPIRLPVSVATAAVLLFVLATLIEVQVNNHHFRQLQNEIERVYREVVPAGVLVDAEQQLRNQLILAGRTGDSASLLSMLDRVAPTLAQGDDVRLHRLNYSAAQGELVLGVSATNNAELLALVDRISQMGLDSRPQNLSPMGARQHASVLIQESRR